MDQWAIVMYLARKGLTAVAIHEHLLATLGAEVISYPSVTCHLREAKFATSNPEVTFSEPIRKHNDCDQAIILASDRTTIYVNMPIGVTHSPAMNHSQSAFNAIVGFPGP
jgi:hypothetical protein